MNAELDSNIYFKNKRDQYVVEIRKRKNEEFIQKKRRKLTDGSYGKNGPNDLMVSQQTQLEALQQFTELANSFLNALKSNNFEQIAAIAELIRRAISNTENPPLDIFIGTGVVPHIVKLLDYEFFEHEKLIIECAWIIANVASGTPIHVEYLVELGIASKTLDLIDHPNEDVKDNAIWILANIAGDSTEYRDILINLGIVLKLERMLDGESYRPSFLAHVSWLISNICRGKPYPRFSDIEPLMKVVQFFVLQIDQEEVMNNSMWTLSYFSDGDDDQIKAVLDLELTPYIISMMSSKEPHMRAPALRTIGNLLTGKDELTDILVKAGVIPALSQRLDDEKKLFRKEACWCLSNILAGTPHQIEQVFVYNNREVLKKLINMVYNDELDVARECIFCLTNPCSEGTLQHVQILVDFGIIELLVETLKTNTDVALVKICLETIEHILSNDKQAYTHGDSKQNPYVIKLSQCGGFEVIEALQSHPDNDIYQVVSRIIDKHLDYEVA